MDGSPIMFTPDQQNFVVCSNFQSQENQTNSPVLGEITADQILDMPIVFADETQEETNQMTENSSYIYPSTDVKKEVIKEEPVDEDEDVDIMCSPVSKTAIPERLNIKQVYGSSLYIYKCIYLYLQ